MFIPPARAPGVCTSGCLATKRAAPGATIPRRMIPSLVGGSPEPKQRARSGKVKHPTRKLMRARVVDTGWSDVVQALSTAIPRGGLLAT
jgi:hypothetical protein